MLLKKRTVRNHHGGVRMESDAASMAALNFRGIHHMIEMSVHE
jgi:hypothetical protein